MVGECVQDGLKLNMALISGHTFPHSPYLLDIEEELPRANV